MERELAVEARPPTHGVCASRGGGGASDSRTVRNGTCLRRSSLLGQLQVCVRMRMRVGVCGYAWACGRE